MTTITVKRTKGSSTAIWIYLKFFHRIYFETRVRVDFAGLFDIFPRDGKLSAIPFFDFGFSLLQSQSKTRFRLFGFFLSGVPLLLLLIFFFSTFFEITEQCVNLVLFGRMLLRDVGIGVRGFRCLFRAICLCNRLLSLLPGMEQRS